MYRCLLFNLDSVTQGGHLSHGYQTPTKKISAVSSYFETLPYQVNEITGLVDYDMLEKTAKLYRPKILICGASAYARNWDYKRFRKIADEINAYLMVDMAHISGMISAGVLESPFDYADIITTTTHKSLRGPRGAMIFFRKGVRSTGKKGDVLYDLERPINFSVFPGHQGGPHNHTIAALAVALKQTQSIEFKDYQKSVISNAKTMENEFRKLGYNMVSDGTDTHLLLLDLRSKKIDGARVERVLELVNIATNKNTIPSDKSALIPSGLRLGSPAMTTRGLSNEDFKEVVGFIDESIKLTIQISASVNGTRIFNEGTKIKDFKEFLGNGENIPGVLEIRKRVVGFAKKFPVIGFDVSTMKYKSD